MSVFVAAVVFILVAICDMATTQSAVNQTLRYFDQQQSTWTWVAINYSSEEFNAYYVHEQAGVLSVNSNRLEIVRETFGTGIVAIQTEMESNTLLLPVPQCLKRRISVNYKVHYTVNNTLFGTWSGLHHKIVLSNDNDRLGQPRGLGFTFATGSSRFDSLKNYTWPNANVYVHNDNLVCTVLQAGCLLAENKNIVGGRLYSGDYNISFNAIVDTATGLMSAESYVVSMSNQTFSATIFNVTEPQLALASKTQAWNWLRPNFKPRVYLMAVATSLILSDLTIDVSDICDVALSSFTFPTTTTTTPSQQSTTTSSSQESTNTASLQENATTNAVETILTFTASDATISSTSLTETLPFQTTQNTTVVDETILLPPVADEDTTLIVVAIVVPLCILLTTIVVCYLCRRRLRRSAVCLHCFYLCPMLFACCSDKMGDEYGSSSSDSPLAAMVLHRNDLGPLESQNANGARATAAAGDKSKRNAGDAAPVETTTTGSSRRSTLANSEYTQMNFDNIPIDDDGYSRLPVKMDPSGTPRRLPVYDSVQPANPDRYDTAKPRNAYEQVPVRGGHLLGPALPLPPPPLTPSSPRSNGGGGGNGGGAVRPALIYDRVLGVVNNEGVEQIEEVETDSSETKEKANGGNNDVVGIGVGALAKHSKGPRPSQYDSPQSRFR